MKASQPLPFLSVLALLCSLPASQLQAQDDARWFQIEVSIFTNERAADREEELWLADQTELDYPDNSGRLQRLFDLLMIEALQPAPISDTDPVDALQSEQEQLERSAQEERLELIAATGPFAEELDTGNGAYRFPDFARDAFVQLTPDESDFQQTNQALVRSPDHRLLFHGLWRQPMPDPGAQTPITVSGGDRYGAHHELEGSLSLHFNNGRDRVVIDADLWLSEFRVAGLTNAIDSESSWRLPPVPESSRPAAHPTESVEPETDYTAVRVYPFQQSREMRSTEFHYLDHPALGIVVTVEPYEVPPVPEPDPDQ